jgi:iron-sulfur cluster assembly protein
MFDTPVTMTDSAARRIRDLMPDTNAGLRIGLKKGGCAGMEYTMDIVTSADKNDIVIEHEGARILLAPTAQMFLLGTEVDFETGLLESGFKFRNPNVSDACGCGESVSFSIDELTKNAVPSK